MGISGIFLLAALKYVFLFIGDGMATPQRMVAEEFSVKTGSGPLAMNSMPFRSATATRSANSVVTDSAASATAIACGEKTNNGMLGIDPKGRRLESVAEVAGKTGMKIGILTNVAIGHATPAGFYAHQPKRSLYYRIGLDLLASGFDHFAGAGLFGRQDDRSDSEYRGDIFKLAADAGYTVTRDRKGWEALKPGGRSWSVFGNSAMQFAIDDDGRYPKLHEMLDKCISLLDNPDGFFIMCEGGKIDYSGHANDAATNIKGVLALDRAVKSAIAFMERHPGETLVIVTGDHETGGMSMGMAGTGGRIAMEKLAAQNISVELFSGRIKELITQKKGEVGFKDVEPLLKKHFGLKSFTSSERGILVSALEKDVRYIKTGLKDTTAHNVRRKYVFAQAVKNVLAARAGVAWNTFNHTALPTLTTAVGYGAENFGGISDNTEIGVNLKKLIAGRTR